MKEQVLRRINIVMYSEAIFSLEIFFAPIMIAFYLNYIGLTFQEMSLFFSTSLITGWILEIPSGAFSDWFGRKKAFLFGKFIYLIGMLSLLVIKDFELLLVIAFILSLGSSMGSGNLSAIIYENLDTLKIEKDAFFRISSRAGSFSFLSSAIASILGGYLGTIDLRIPLILDCIFIFSTILIGWTFIEERSNSYLLKNNQGYSQKLVLIKFKKAFVDMFNLTKEGFLLSIRNNKILFIFLVSSISFGILRTGFNFYQPIFEEFSINLEVFGIILAIFNVIAAVTSYFAGKTPENFIESNGFIILTVIFLSLSGFLVYFNFGFTILVGLAFAIHQIVRGFITPYISYSINKEIPLGSKSRTTILSFDFLLRAAVGTLIMTLSGIITTITGLSIGFVIVSLSGALILLLLCVVFQSISKKQREPASLTTKNSNF